MSDSKIGNKLEAWGFRSPNFGFKDSPSLGATAKKSMGEFYKSYCPEDMQKLNPPVVKQAKECLERAFKDDVNIKGLPPMVEKEESNPTSKHPPNWSQLNTQEKADSMSKISCMSNVNSHHSKEERQHQSAISPGIVAWNDMFKSDDLKLPDASFMNQVRQAVPREQFNKLLMAY